MRLQLADRWEESVLEHIRHIARYAVLGMVILASVTTWAFAQQGFSRGLPALTRTPNDSCIILSPVSVFGREFVLFISSATNLIPGVGGCPIIYAQDVQTGELFYIPFCVIDAEAVEKEDGQGIWVVASFYNVNTGDTNLARFDSSTGAWTYFDINLIRRNRQVYEITSRGDIFAVEQVNDTLRRIVRIDINGNKEVLHEYSDPPHSTRAVWLTASEDGRIVAAHRITDQSMLMYLRVEYPTDDGEWEVVSSVLPGFGGLVVDNVEYGFSIIDASGMRMVATDGGIYQVQLASTEQGEPSLQVVLVDRYPQLRNAVPIDMRDDKILYVPFDLRENRFELRLLDLATQTDVPIARVLEEDLSRSIGSRWIKAGRIAFSATDEPGYEIIPGDNNRKADVFLYDPVRVQTFGVSIGAQPRKGLSQGVEAGYNADLIAFTSDSRDLVVGKTTEYHDVFVSLNGQLIRLLGVGGVEPDGSSFQVSVSREPSTPAVAFASFASNLVADDANSGSDVFVWMPEEGIRCVTCSLLEGGDSFQPVIAPNAVYFLSTATSLIPPDAGSPQAYQWMSGSIRVIRSPEGAYFDSVESLVVSPNGRYVVLTASLLPDQPLGIYVYLSSQDNLIPITQLQLSSDLKATDVSDEGQIVLNTRARLTAEDVDEMDDVYVWDIRSGQLSLVSRNPVGSKANGPSYGGRIDAGGNKVVFVSQGSNLVAGDLNQEEDVFVYDLVRNTLYCVTREQMGLPIGGSQACITGDGSTVVFITGRSEVAWMPASEGVFVALHQIGCIPNGDVNLDGAVDDSDLLAILLAFGHHGDSLADLNVDGIVDDTDVLIVLFHYGEDCQFRLLGDNGSNRDEMIDVRLERSESGRTVLYYTRRPRYLHFDNDTTQRADIDRALQGRWPYPVAGGLFNPWKHEFGDPSEWTDAEIEAFRQFIEGSNGGDGDFAPASGNWFNWSWTRTYAYQPRGDTYVRFRPTINFVASCAQTRVAGNAVASLDMKILGQGQNDLAKFYAYAATYPVAWNQLWLGYEAYIQLRGSNIWKAAGATTRQTSMNGSKHFTRNINLLNGSFSFTLFGIPCIVYFTISGYAAADLYYSINALSYASTTFIPSVRFNATVGGGVGGNILGVRVVAGMELNLNPLLYLRIPASAWLNRNGCVLDGRADVWLTLNALRGNLRGGIFTSCINHVWCPRCRTDERKDINVFGISIPAYCCGNSCTIRGRQRRVSASGQIANWSGINYESIPILQRSWQWRIK